MINLFSLKHDAIDVAKPDAEALLKSGRFAVPRLSVDIINNRWRAYQKSENLSELDPEVAKFVRAALEHIVLSDIILDQRDVYYGIRGKYPNWKISGHELKTEEGYNTFVGKIMESLQLVTGYTMQSLGVRAGPRGYVTGEDSYFVLPDGKRIPVVANPVIQFNLVDTGVEFYTQTRKLIHYEKAAGMNSLLIEHLPTMIEATFMTSQGYAVEAATKMHRDMEKRGLKLYILGDADPHGMNIQLMYGRGSKSNAYMPDDFFPRNAVLLGLFPRIANELGLPAEHVTDIHMRVVPNVRKLAEETRPDMVGDVEIFENERKQFEWQSLNGLGDVAPAIYMVEALYARGDEIKYVPEENALKEAIIKQIEEDLSTYAEEKVEQFARKWLNENLLPDLIKQFKEKFFSNDLEEFHEMAEQAVEDLSHLPAGNFREAVKKKLVSYPRQYYSNAAGNLAEELINKKFTIDAKVEATIDVKDANVESSVTTNQMDVPDTPLQKIDIVEAIEKRVTGKSLLIAKIRSAIQKILGVPDETW